MYRNLIEGHLCFSWLYLLGAFSLKPFWLKPWWLKHSDCSHKPSRRASAPRKWTGKRRIRTSASGEAKRAAEQAMPGTPPKEGSLRRCRQRAGPQPEVLEMLEELWMGWSTRPHGHTL